MRQRYLLPIALGIAAILLFCWLVVRSSLQPSLSPLEARTVGEWIWNSGEGTRTFWPDRGFSTANGQFEGRWSIEDNKLTLEYWQPFRLQEIHGVNDFLDQLRRSRKTDTYTWEIEFGDEDRTLLLTNPKDHPRNPGGTWELVRPPDNNKERAGRLGA